MPKKGVRRVGVESTETGWMNRRAFCSFRNISFYVCFLCLPSALSQWQSAGDCCLAHLVLFLLPASLRYFFCRWLPDSSLDCSCSEIQSNIFKVPPPITSSPGCHIILNMTFMYSFCKYFRSTCSVLDLKNKAVTGSAFRDLIAYRVKADATQRMTHKLKKVTSVQKCQQALPHVPTIRYIQSPSSAFILSLFFVLTLKECLVTWALVPISPFLHSQCPPFSLPPTLLSFSSPASFPSVSKQTLEWCAQELPGRAVIYFFFFDIIDIQHGISFRCTT